MYRATKRPDGALVVHHVPIFVECDRGKVSFDAAWLRAALEKAQQAALEGYLPPLHVYHHTDEPGDQQVRAAGFFRVTDVGKITFKGEEKLALFADLVVTDPGVAYDVLAKRLPYRSVEIMDVSAPSIDSLALLNHQAPYLELPMLMVADVVESAAPVAVATGVTFANPWLSKAARGEHPVVACFRRGRAVHVLTQDAEAKMDAADTLKKLNAAEGDKPPAPDAAPADKPGEPAAPEAAAGAGEVNDVDVKAVVAAIDDGSIAVADLQAILEAINKRRAASAQPDSDQAAASKADVPSSASSNMSKNTTETPAADPKGAAPVPAAPAKAPAPTPAADGDLRMQFAKLQGENDALRARLDARDAGDAASSDVAAALKRLAGRPLGAEAEGKMLAFHKAHGAEAFKEYVAAIEANVPPIPRHAADAAARALGNEVGAGADQLPDEVAAYTELGPDAVRHALQFSAEYDQLRSSGMRATRERYIADHLARKGVRLPAKRKPAATGAA